MLRSLATAVVLAIGLASTAHAAEIVRHKNEGAGLILKGVTVPAGAATLYLSGQTASPIDPAKKMSDVKSIEEVGDTRTQTINILTKIKAALAGLGYAMSDVVKMTVFVVGDPRMGGKMDFAGMNDGFRQFFNTADNPNTVARSTVQVVSLAGPYALVEIEVTAAKVK